MATADPIKFSPPQPSDARMATADHIKTDPVKKKKEPPNSSPQCEIMPKHPEKSSSSSKNYQTNLPPNLPPRNTQI
jgi:hypothetical protein